MLAQFHSSTKPDTHLCVDCIVCIQAFVVPSCKVPEDLLICRTMYKLLRSTCLHCFQLKMAQKEVDKYTERLTLLAKGKLTEAAAVMTGGGKAADFAQSLIAAGEEGENANENVAKGKSKGTQRPSATTAPLDGMPNTYSLPDSLCDLFWRSVEAACITA